MANTLPKIPAAAIHMYQALYGQAPGNPFYTAYLTEITATSDSAFAFGLAANFAKVPDIVLAKQVLNNLSINTTTVNAISYGLLEDALVIFFGVYPTARAQVILNLTNLLAPLESDAVFGPAATTYNLQATANFSYSVNPANTSAGKPIVGGTNDFILTTGADLIPGLIGSDGSNSNSGDNVISATLQNSGSGGATNESTLNSTDRINAGDGMDTLNILIPSLTGSITVAPTLTNVEKVSVSYIANVAQAATVDLVSATGISTLEFKNSSTQSIAIIKNAPANAVIRFDNADSTSIGHQVNLGSATNRAGSTDAFNITIANGSGAIDVPAGLHLITPTGNGDTSFEIANITIEGSSSFFRPTVSLSGLTTINVSGAATDVTTGFALTLTQEADFPNLKTVNASGLAGGGLSVDARASTATGFSFSGSNANDRVVINSATLNNASTLNGGLGKDILATTSFTVSPSVINSATGFEVLECVSPSGGVVANSFTSINEFVFSGSTNSGRVNITGVESNDRFVFANDQVGGDEVVQFTGASVGNSVLFEMRAAPSTNGEIIITARSNSPSDESAIGFRGGISAVTIDSTGQNSNANLIQAFKSNGDSFYALNNTDGLVNFSITGSQSLTIAAKEGVDLSSSSKAFGFHNSANVNASSFSGVLRIAGSSSNDVIIGGSGNDIIYGLGGSDVLTGNGGADQFRMMGTSGTDVIKDFLQGTDKIGFNNIDFGNTTATSAGTILSLQDYVDNRNGITSMGASDNNKVVELQAALSTSQIQNDNTSSAVQAYVVVFNSSTNKAELWFDTNWSDFFNRTQVATFDNIVDLVGVKAFSNVDFVEFIA